MHTSQDRPCVQYVQVQVGLSGVLCTVSHTLRYSSHPSVQTTLRPLKHESLDSCDASLIVCDRQHGNAHVAGHRESGLHHTHPDPGTQQVAATVTVVDGDSHLDAVRARSFEEGHVALPRLLEMGVQQRFQLLDRLQGGLKTVGFARFVHPHCMTSNMDDRPRGLFTSTSRLLKLM